MLYKYSIILRNFCLFPVSAVILLAVPVTNSFSQCTTNGVESSTVTLTITCLDQTTLATQGIGKGSERVYLGFTGDQFYTLSLSDGGGTNCRQARFENAAQSITTTYVDISAGNTIFAPAGTDRLRVRTTRSNTTWSTTSSLLTYRRTTPTLTANTTSNQTVCVGASVSIGGGTATNGIRYWQGTTNSGTSTATSGTPNSTGVLGSTGSFIYYYRPENGGCWGTQQGTTITVVADPVRPGINTLSVASGTEVCRGQVINVTLNAGTDGTGTIQDSYRFSLDNGATWTTQTGTGAFSINTATATGTVLLQTQRTATGTDCNISDWLTLASWPTVPQPVRPSINTISVASGTTMCRGQVINVTLNPGSGGTGTIQDSCRFSLDNGSTWTTVNGTGPFSINTTAATNTVLLQTQRTASGAGCNTAAWATVASWPTVAQPGLSASITSSPVCGPAGSNEATLTAVPTGGTGTPTYEWQWSPDGTAGWTSAGAGTTLGGGTVLTTPNLTATRYYRVRVSYNGVGCNTTNWVNVGPIVIPTVPVLQSTSVTGCGQATIFAQPGNGATTCRFYNGFLPNGVPSATGTSFTISTPGTYTVYVTSFDAVTGCEKLDAFSTVTVNVSSTFNITLTNPNSTAYNGQGVTCFGALDGAITANVTSTNFPIEYAWSNNVTNNVSSNTNTISGLGSGAYSIVATDAGGCVASASFTLSTPLPISASGTTSNFNNFGVSCNGGANGSISLNVSGGTSPYTYSWSSNPSGFSGNTQSVSGLTAREYTAVITDANACQSTQVFNITQPAPLTLAFSTGFVCSGNSYVSAILTLTGSGGVPPYEYSINNGSTWQSSPQFPGLPNGGSYTMLVRDDNNCTSSVVNTTVNFPPPGQPVDDCNFIYVSPAGDPSTNLGSKNCPANLLQAFQIYSNTPSRNVILMLEGSYSFNQKITVPGGVTIIGGHTVNGNGEWIRNSGATTTLTINPPLETATVSSVTVGHHIGIDLGGNNIRFKDLTISVLPAGASGVTGDRGRSVYGIYNNGRTGIELVRCNVSTGAASGGSNGAAQSGAGSAGGGGNGAGATLDFKAGCSQCGIGGASGSPGNGGASGGVGGNGCCSSGCFLGCNSNGCNASNGSAGQSGAAGSGFSAGDRPSAASGLNTFFVPVNGVNGGNGFGGGGGGAGGAGASGTCCTCTCGPNWATGGAGGAGGAGGLGGNFGFGGGSSIGIYSNGGVIQLNDVLFNPGAAGIGGSGAAGQSGSPGSSGSLGGDNTGWCDGGRGGTGGTGGAGGTGGRGRDGANGISQGFVNVNGASITQSGTTVPNLGVLTVENLRGCLNSEITITKTTGSWNFISTNPAFVNDLTNGTTSFTNASNNAKIFYTTTGQKDVQIGATVFKGFIDIRQDRALGLPVINPIVTPCINASINLSTPTSGAVEYEWTISTVSNPTSNLFTFTSQNPGVVNPPSGGWNPSQTYQVRLRTRETCCGWSRPVYATFIPIDVPAQPSVILIDDPIVCANQQNVVLSVTNVAGVTYNWAVSGGSIQSGQGTNSITVNLGSAGALNVTVTPSNSCGTGPVRNGAFTINQNPVASVLASPSLNVCSQTINLQASASAGTGGNGSFAYLWSTTQTSSLISVSNSGSYTVTVTEGVSGCVNSTTVNVLIESQPTAPSLDVKTPNLSLICQGIPVSATTIPGLGGGAGAADEFRFSIDGGGSWTAYSPGANINTSSASGSIIIQARRTGGSFTGCNTTSWVAIADWSLALPPSAFTPVIANSTPLCYRGNARIDVASSQSGVTYQLRENTSNVGSSQVGNGSTLTFHSNNLTAANSSYNVLATTGLGCTLVVNVPNITVNSAPGALATNNTSRICYVNGNNEFVEFTGSTGIIAAINPVTQNLGEVTITEYVHGAPLNVQACNTYQTWFQTATLNRHWFISSTVAPTGPLDIRLYYADADLTALQAVANFNANPNDDISIPDQLDLNKYSGTNENDIITDNCFAGNTTIHLTLGTGAVTVGNVGYAIAGVSFNRYSISSFSELWLAGTNNVSPLPIVLQDFSASCEDGQVKLTWTTATEINNERFFIHRSSDLIAWEEVLTVPGSGNSNAPLTYSGIDDRPLNGLSYYRLTQQDYDGTFESFEPISIICYADGKGNTMLVFPNLAEDKFTVAVTLAETLIGADLEISDINGKRVLMRRVNLEKGTNEFMFDRSSMNPGTYFIQLRSDKVNLNPIKLIVK